MNRLRSIAAWLTFPVIFRNLSARHNQHRQHGRGENGLYFTWRDRLMGAGQPACQTRLAEIACQIQTWRRPRDVIVAAQAAGA